MRPNCCTVTENNVFDMVCLRYVGSDSQGTHTQRFKLADDLRQAAVLRGAVRGH